jgi:CheY-like chemotaxis protein
MQREAIVPVPIVGESMRQALAGGVAQKAAEGKAKTINAKRREMSKTYPLSILLVDDNMVNLLVAQRILDLFGYKNTSSAAGGDEAIEAARATDYDLILMDLQMPVVDGFMAQERIQAERNRYQEGGPCIVALSANADKVSSGWVLLMSGDRSIL